MSETLKKSVSTKSEAKMPGSAGSPATRKSMANGSSPATKTARSSRLAP